MILQICFFI